MNFAVVWLPVAQDRFAEVWMAAADRRAVTRAAARVDRLRVNPDALGDLRFDTVRSLIVGPLGVEFDIREADRLVRVLSAWDATAAPPDPIGN